MRKSMAYIFSGFGLFAFQLSAFNFDCGDSSYAYNQAVMVETAERFELSLDGSGLGPIEFATSGENISIPWWSGLSSFHIPFKKSECSFNDEKTKGHCEKVRLAIDNAAYLERSIPDISNNNPTAISPIHALKITADFELGGQIKVVFHGSRWKDPKQLDQQEISFGLDYCPHKDIHRKLGFPQRLRDYINKPQN